jgi:hypothetical protein
MQKQKTYIKHLLDKTNDDSSTITLQTISSPIKDLLQNYHDLDEESRKALLNTAISSGKTIMF